MSRLLLTLICASQDAETLADTLRDTLQLPVQHRQEAVFGRDFGDAETGEQVTGALSRCALEVDIDGDDLSRALDAVGSARRRLPLRWRTTAILDGGRIL